MNTFDTFVEIVGRLDLNSFPRFFRARRQFATWAQDESLWRRLYDHKFPTELPLEVSDRHRFQVASSLTLTRLLTVLFHCHSDPYHYAYPVLALSSQTHNTAIDKCIALYNSERCPTLNKLIHTNLTLPFNLSPLVPDRHRPTVRKGEFDDVFNNGQQVHRIYELDRETISSQLREGELTLRQVRVYTKPGTGTGTPKRVRCFYENYPSGFCGLAVFVGYTKLEADILMTFSQNLKNPLRSGKFCKDTAIKSIPFFS